jgi:hypothetical protein
MSRKKGKADGTGDYRVGYGKPPEAHRFRPGQSGNPSGRPKAKRSMDLLICNALRKKVAVTEDGERRSVPIEEIIAKQVAKKAANGDFRSIKLALDALNRSAAEKDREDAPRPPPASEELAFDPTKMTNAELETILEAGLILERHATASARQSLILPPTGPAKPIWEEEGYDVEEDNEG